MTALSKHYSDTTSSIIIPQLFSLAISHAPTTTWIDVEFFINAIDTSHFPQTHTVLKALLPSILQAKCFNKQQLPFAVEVFQTELGHLFEHILLEYLCLEKLSVGYETAVFNGMTNWNWKREKYGTFHIAIDAGLDHAAIFPSALQKSIQLLRIIIEKEVNKKSYETAQVYLV